MKQSIDANNNVIRDSDDATVITIFDPLNLGLMSHLNDHLLKCSNLITQHCSAHAIELQNEVVDKQ